MYLVYMYYESIDLQLHVQKSDREGTPRVFVELTFPIPRSDDKWPLFRYFLGIAASTPSGIPCSELYWRSPTGTDLPISIHPFSESPTKERSIPYSPDIFLIKAGPTESQKKSSRGSIESRNISAIKERVTASLSWIRYT